MPDFSKLFPKTKDSLLFKEMDDGAVVYEPAEELCYSLNSSSAYVYALCDGHFSLSEIINLIEKDFLEFEQKPEKAILEIIKTFQDNNLLEKKLYNVINKSQQQSD